MRSAEVITPESPRSKAAAAASIRFAVGLVIVFALLGAGLYYVAPWVLPVRIVEGPLVQDASADGLTLCWWTTRAAECELSAPKLTGGPRRAVADGTRHTVRLTGLAPSRSYSYEIALPGGRRLFAGTLQTNRQADEEVTFLVFGDSGRRTPEQYRLAGMMNLQKPDFMLHTGDVVYPDGARGRYEASFFAPYAPLLARVPFWPCVGNHDVSEGVGSGPYRDVFVLPENGPAGLSAETNYWFDYGPARVAVFNSNLGDEKLRDVVAPWLRAVLAEEGPLWRFVVCHHPPYTAGKYQPNPIIQQAIVPVLEQAGVDVMFNGHDHTYQRTLPMRGGEAVSATEGEPHGVVYIVTGAGGARLYELLPPDQRPAYIAAANNAVHSFTWVHLAGPRLRLRQLTADGTVLDDWTTTKP